MAFQPFGVHGEGMPMFRGEIVVAEDLLEQRNRCGNAFDHELIEYAAHTGYCGFAILRGDNDLAHHRIEFRRYGVAFDHTGVDADAWAGRPHDAFQRAGSRGQVGVGILGGDTQFEAVPTRCRCLGQLAAVCNGELLSYQSRPLTSSETVCSTLQTWVDFKEVDLALLSVSMNSQVPSPT